jgi:hypothetical protein
VVAVSGAVAGPGPEGRGVVPDVVIVGAERDGPVGFRRATWEGLYRLPLMSGGDAAPLRRYFENKTSKLTKAFIY